MWCHRAVGLIQRRLLTCKAFMITDCMCPCDEVDATGKSLISIIEKYRLINPVCDLSVLILLRNIFHVTYSNASLSKH